MWLWVTFFFLMVVGFEFRASSTLPSDPVCWVFLYFWDRISQITFPGWPPTTILLSSASWVTSLGISSFHCRMGLIRPPWIGWSTNQQCIWIALECQTHSRYFFFLSLNSVHRSYNVLPIPSVQEAQEGEDTGGKGACRCQSGSCWIPLSHTVSKNTNQVKSSQQLP